ncbi:hypothetical protein BpHYR1_024124 [Brachionus plicatilis]|uniref:Phospholipase A(2) n=1 Tax=Brachionus plicatilis TaxID=10195 RepID=A0A3M7TAN1_BRAPC|nr:hypothetical protein BpHYR1_024124 [Brachionus plicatilis]
MSKAAWLISFRKFILVLPSANDLSLIISMSILELSSFKFYSLSLKPVIEKNPSFLPTAKVTFRCREIQLVCIFQALLENFEIILHVKHHVSQKSATSDVSQGFAQISKIKAKKNRLKNQIKTLYRIASGMFLVTYQGNCFNTSFNFEKIIKYRKTLAFVFNTTSGKVLGCGPGKFTIDQQLIDLGEGSLIECCARHDLCYDACKYTQIQCDDQFEICMRIKCNRLSGFSRILCKIDASNMVSLLSKISQSVYGHLFQSILFVKKIKKKENQLKFNI